MGTGPRGDCTGKFLQRDDRKLQFRYRNDGIKLAPCFGPAELGTHGAFPIQ